MTDGISAEDRVLDAALTCISRWGLTKTTAEDIASEASVSRATVYRLFPGGRTAILQRLAFRELAALGDRVVSDASGRPGVEATLTAGIVSGAGALQRHPAVAYLARHEPDSLLPFISFDRLDPALALVRTTFAPLLVEFVDDATAGDLVEWAARVVLSALAQPGWFDVTDPIAVEAFVRRYLSPGIAACGSAASGLPERVAPRHERTTDRRSADELTATSGRGRGGRDAVAYDADERDTDLHNSNSVPGGTS
ncbi:MAG: TetR/AcrR family transcriptional regulator [Microthrixaceae bacterium]